MNYAYLLLLGPLLLVLLFYIRLMLTAGHKKAFKSNALYGVLIIAVAINSILLWFMLTTEG